jgi:hypothetical protein
MCSINQDEFTKEICWVCVECLMADVVDSVPNVGEKVTCGTCGAEYKVER